MICFMAPLRSGSKFSFCGAKLTRHESIYMTLTQFLGGIAVQDGNETLKGSRVFVTLRRSIDLLVRYPLSLGSFDRGEPSP
jgi:hypothetical protein